MVMFHSYVILPDGIHHLDLFKSWFPFSIHFQPGQVKYSMSASIIAVARLAVLDNVSHLRVLQVYTSCKIDISVYWINDDRTIVLSAISLDITPEGIVI
jgi:hypothetical protein